MNYLVRYFLCFPDDDKVIKELSAYLGQTQIIPVEDSIAVVVKYSLTGLDHLSDIISKMTACDENISETLTQIVGYSTVFFNQEKWDEELFWQQRKHAETQLKTGQLAFNVAQRHTHYYIFRGQTNAEEIDNFLQDFLRFDMSVFKISYQAFHFQDQLDSMIEERKCIDEVVGKVLYNHSAGNNTDESIELWESNIQQLAGAFSGLGGYLPVIKKMESTLSRAMDGLYKNMKRIKYEVPIGDPLVKLTAGWVKKRIENLHKVGEDLAISRDNAYAAINVVQTQVNLIRAKKEVLLQEQMGIMLKQNVSLQKEGIALQVAAVFIEFIVVNYYSLSIWKTVASEEAFHHIPGWLKFATVFSFAAATVLCTHFVAEKKLHDTKKAKTGLISTIVALIGIFALMVVFSIVY